MPLDFQGSSHDRRLRRRPPPDYLSRRTQYRIFALVGSLFLILFLMEQARKPENWRWVWTVGGGPAPTERDVDTRLRDPSGGADGGAGTNPVVIPANDGEPAVPAVSESPAGKPAPDALAPLRRARYDLWSRLLESLGNEDRTALLSGLKAGRDQKPLPAETQAKWPPIVEQVQAGSQDYVNKAFLAVSQDSSGLTNEEKRSWLEVIEALKREWESGLQPAFQTLGQGQTLGAKQQAAVAGLQETLDAVFLDSVRDNTVFRVAEKDAWFRLFEQLQDRDLAELRRASTGYVGFLQLYKQPTEYRGKLVTVSGTVRMGYYREAPQNLYGIQGYYVFWLKPAGAKSPIVVYCLELPAGFPDVVKLEREGDGARPQLDEEAEFTGFFFKRWAYRAQDDTRLAPLILAKAPRWTPRPEAGGTADQPPGVGFWIALFGGTAAFGIGLALVFYWLTRRTPAAEFPLHMEFIERGDEKP
ncbi:MAG: hypothetical protein GX575_10065 [Candidatus Anammoximicrobium sp.]|nr:hypothetical protein [Candidatus Anammoximicrobium sp.]